MLCLCSSDRAYRAPSQIPFQCEGPPITRLWQVMEVRYSKEKCWKSDWTESGVSEISHPQAVSKTAQLYCSGSCPEQTAAVTSTAVWGEVSGCTLRYQPFCQIQREWKFSRSLTSQRLLGLSRLARSLPACADSSFPRVNPPFYIQGSAFLIQSDVIHFLLSTYRISLVIDFLLTLYTSKWQVLHHLFKWWMVFPSSSTHTSWSLILGPYN